MTLQKLQNPSAFCLLTQVKDKRFELELSWVGEMTKGLHQLVPKDVYEEADNYGKEALKEAENDSDDD